MQNPITNRPAETSAPIAVAIAYLIGRAFGLDTEAVASLAIVLSFAPFAVSWTIDRVRGRRPDPPADYIAD